MTGDAITSTDDDDCDPSGLCALKSFPEIVTDSRAATSSAVPDSIAGYVNLLGLASSITDRVRDLARDIPVYEWAVLAMFKATLEIFRVT
jgi:hypothetical protein